MLEILRQTVRSELSRDEADLTLRQLGVFLAAYSGREPQTVGGLAKVLSISQPVVARALNSLTDADLMLRTHDPTNGRRNLFLRTGRGDAMLRRLGRAMASAANAI